MVEMALTLTYDFEPLMPSQVEYQLYCALPTCFRVEKQLQVLLFRVIKSFLGLSLPIQNSMAK